jgi:hypothetical protein
MYTQNLFSVKMELADRLSMDWVNTCIVHRHEVELY